MNDSFATRDILEVNGKRYPIRSLAKLGQRFDLTRLPYSMKILLENLLRHEDGANVTREATSKRSRTGTPKKEPDTEIAFMPARVRAAGLHRRARASSTSPRCAMRWRKLGGDPSKINPLSPADLVIDHSVQVDAFGTPDALDLNVEIEFERNRERYSFLRWGQKAFENFKVVPPRHRHRAPGQPRVPRARRDDAREGRRDWRLSRTPWSAPTRTPR